MPLTGLVTLPTCEALNCPAEQHLLAQSEACLIERYGSRCNIYLEPFPERELQIDHRVPFEIAGDGALSENLDDYMLLSPSANRAKW